ncbi:hypothetical protein MGYG_01022 [Nannizzia gypsea CBS 118893]|uniref:Transcription regulator Rua1 C-terminal domain-containing protein n=1 Tax=Arthroderma gypseum (strain ATCC MYA-4604 / CBS 118893) TaxID=535722 RepID=E5R3S6_ARTGP|nr:hypothetical protein MGYG_01022 [Nannizzia gypsea CBS 118893]EFQ97986.1 hypothetical protein MGYG_01022 [Nannizzia gypsea CBS 118893]
MSTGEIEYRSALQQSEYIPSSQALPDCVGGHFIRQDGIPVGHGGVHSSEYPWTYLPMPKFGASDGCVGANPLHNGMYKGDMVDDHTTLPSLGSDFANRASSEVESLPSWENSPRSTMAQLTVDTAVPTTQPPSGFVSASMGYNDISAYSDMPSSSSAFTPCSSLYYSNTPLSPSASPRRQQQYSGCLEVELGTMAATSPGAPHARQLNTYSYDACGSGWVKTSSTNSNFVHQPHGNAAFAESSPSVQKSDHYPVLSAVDTTEEKAEPKEVKDTLPPPLPKPRARAKEPKSGMATPKRKTKQGAARKASGNKCCRGHHDIDHYSDLANPPDLLEPLKDNPSQPPPEDMFPSDPMMIPREQEPRFEGDMYTPTWIRGHGNKREGWCGICKPGRWLVLKNSGYWYDKSFTHGISATTGQAFSPPKHTRRSQGNANIWEGLCENCDSWVGLVSSKKRGTTWFRHAYKCYNGCSTSNSKAEGTLKRRRANSESDDSRPSTRPK